MWPAYPSKQERAPSCRRRLLPCSRDTLGADRRVQHMDPGPVDSQLGARVGGAMRSVAAVGSDAECRQVDAVDRMLELAAHARREEMLDGAVCECGDGRGSGG